MLSSLIEASEGKVSINAGELQPEFSRWGPRRAHDKGWPKEEENMKCVIKKSIYEPSQQMCLSQMW
jgi:hypothetical protein